ncbi:DEKNAAC105333 [Brettanomyces naardenensis]|uniref:DEKNAAC105333 n=1 Tax=Brettanomyces naardenensis TaxID=13370 RepID=A0A448YTH5_BRENA|nr:DEKNAAC105333 [Brettanomyces naardenensis]
MDQLWDTVYQMANSVASPKDHPSNPLSPPSIKSASSPQLPSVNSDTSSVSDDLLVSQPQHHHQLSSSNLLSRPKSDRRARSTPSFFDDLFGSSRSINGRQKEQQSSTSPTSDASIENSVKLQTAAPSVGISAVSGVFSNTDIENTESPDTLAQTYTQQVADKFMQRLLAMAVPNTTTEDGRELQSVLSRMEMQKTRPPLNVQTISRNSIALLQRLSIPFTLIDQIIILFNWSNPVYTLCFLLAATLMIMKPVTFSALPFFFLCYLVILPAFIRRHPTDPIDGSPALGPQLTNIQYPQPVPELSREFLLNLTDLQNHMLIYVIPWDYLNYWIVHNCYFKDERFTTLIFLSALFSGIFLTLFGTRLFLLLLPAIKILTVVLLSSFTIAMHPHNRQKILEWVYSEDTRLKVLTITNKLDARLLKELSWRETKEIRQLEIFELQRVDSDSKTWQPVCFTDDIYPTNSHIRLNGLSINGCSSLLGVSPPKGWCFINQTTNVGSSQKMGKSTSSFSQLAVTKSPKSSKQPADRLQLPNETSPKKTHKKTTSNESSSSTSAFSVAKVVDGWYMDLRPRSWVQENYVDEVIDVDEDTKWCYDLVAGERGEFRRRRWVRYCIRDIYGTPEGEKDDTVEEVRGQISE